MKETNNSSSDASSKKGRTRAAAEQVTDAAPDISGDMEDVAESVQRAAHDVGTFVRESAARSPYMTLGVAAGVGFVLGGGLSPRMTTTLLGFGGRLLVNAVMRDITADNN